MYHASELFIIEDLLDIYTPQKQNNECMLSTTGQRQQILVGQKIKKLTELLPCTFAMYDCRQLVDVSIVENVHMVSEILYQFFSGTVTSIFHHLVACAKGILCT